MSTNNIMYSGRKQEEEQRRHNWHLVWQVENQTTTLISRLEHKVVKKIPTFFF